MRNERQEETSAKQIDTSIEFEQNPEVENGISMEPLWKWSTCQLGEVMPSIQGDISWMWSGSKSSSV